MSTPARRSPSALLSGFASRITLSLSPWSIALFLVALIVALPILVVLGHIVMPTEGVWQHLASTVLPRYLSNTFWLVLWVGLGTLVIGTGTAWLVVMCRFPGKRLFEWALLLPLAVPTYVIAYAYTDFLQVAGPLQSLLREWFHWQVGDYYFPNVRSLGGAATLITFVLYPYVYMLARLAFQAQGRAVLEQARILGDGPLRAFFKVALPMARPGIAAGLALALMETLADFGAVSVFNFDTFTTAIYKSWYGLFNLQAAAQLASLLLLFVLVSLWLERRGRRRARFRPKLRRPRRIRRREWPRTPRGR
mgnify:CR=1 FL=1